VPGDARCIDEQGRSVELGARLDRPTILSLVYYNCEHMCPELLVGLGELVQALDLRPGEDYRILTLSFDETDTPAGAAEAKRNYLKPLGPDFPAGAWTFLTASREEIARITEALGFRFVKSGHGFVHPVILAILAPGGRISSYVYPAKFNYGVAYPLAFSRVEIKQALLAAGRGQTTTPPGAGLLFCFPGEPEGQARFFKLLTVVGIATLVVLGGLFVFLATSRRRLPEDR
jgi:protein SCO1/2